MDTRKQSVDVIIPVHGPDSRFEKLIGRLQKQTFLPQRILVINTEEALWERSPIDKSIFARGCTDNGIRLFLRHITEEEFDHGGTRDAAAAMSQADILLFMTQDAVPADTHLIENLAAAFEDDRAGRETAGAAPGCIAAAYARQLPDKNSGVLERYARRFNYGSDSLVKSRDMLPRLGIKTYFCSNVCAAYRRDIYQALGGFEKHTIFNEDMIFAAHLIRDGYRIAYAAGARVIHSHNYSGAQQFRRNFDLAVSQADHPEIFADISSEHEGVRLVKDEAAYLCRNGYLYMLPALFWQSACKYAGYFMGKHYRRLPRTLARFCSMNKKYWKNKLF